MHYELLNGAEAVTQTRKRIRELAERTSNGTRIRLYWRQGTRELWVEVWEPELDVDDRDPGGPGARARSLSPPVRVCRRAQCPSSGRRTARRVAEPRSG